MAKLNAPGEYRILFAPGAREALVLVAQVDTIDLALNVALSLHSMCNTEHLIVVEDIHSPLDYLVTLSRKEYTPLKFKAQQ